MAISAMVWVSATGLAALAWGHPLPPGKNRGGAGCGGGGECHGAALPYYGRSVSDAESDFG